MHNAKKISGSIAGFMLSAATVLTTVDLEMVAWQGFPPKAKTKKRPSANGESKSSLLSQFGCFQCFCPSAPN